MSGPGLMDRITAAGQRCLAVVLLSISLPALALTNIHADFSCSSGTEARFTIASNYYTSPGGYPAGSYNNNATGTWPAVTTPSPLSVIENTVEIIPDGSTSILNCGAGCSYTCTWQDTKTLTATTLGRECKTTSSSNGSGIGGIQLKMNVNLGWVKTCVSPTSCPAAGTVVEGGIKSYTGTSATENVPHKYGDKYCNVTGKGVCVGIPGGSNKGVACAGGWEYTGSQGSSPAFQQTSSSSVCGTDGKTCAPNSPDSQCGTFNGEYVCLNSLPGPGSCMLTPKGSPVCTSTPASPLTTPPAPASEANPSIPETPAAQYTSTATGGSGGTVANVYNPGGAGPDGGDGTETGDPAAEEPGETPDPCGAPGQPKCDVKIDETGSDAVGTDLSAQLGAADASAQADEAAAQSSTVSSANALNPGDGWDFADLVPNLPENSCMTFTVGYFNGDAKEFPPAFLCEAIEEKLKPVLAFFLYALTAFALVTRTTATV